MNKLGLTCNNLCLRLDTSIRPGYYPGKKYCAKCAIYLFFKEYFVHAVGICLDDSPVDKRLSGKRKDKKNIEAV